ncbi:DUF4189 domain-containing protein [Xanthomonas arboricola]|nr:DUF4189 domain-containing protein [Xanthomonas arboricola]MDN0241791.1 DUF4189 domain-containing protein [Xanthomonas arboricola pv. juglandis]MDN0254505.1 DUF4189 domain-containing protein [Xanthomonas arboricola pv. juglandis]MDN0258339.1 DUF4189 domain-containing protein [Xanthomonas arboricola pv. juglandis]MDN0262011.1 DUF4189 domain-containing protein [Xanthomonas arboricola pv. juglandis]MDN0278911.1 DUF4189 domain-containing protein [Xanthomonas arboricola pv. juglandis]
MNRLVLMIAISNCLTVPLIASGQTRCPIGTQMGSMQCIPDTPEMRGELTPSSAPTGEWIKTWGAIANSNSTGEAGSAVGKLSEEEAERVALRQCAVGGAGDCKVQLTYKNQCSALVASDSESFFQASPTEVRAINLAKKSCKASNSGPCNVVYSECTKPIFIKN